MTTDAMVTVPMLERRPLGIPTGLCQSGHWWLYVEGAVGDTREVNVNGTRYQFPTGEWFVANNSYFTAARNSHLRMMWMDGPDVMEKTFTDNPVANQYGIIGERPASTAPDIEQAAVDHFLEDRSKLIVYQSGGPLIEHEG